MHFNNHKGFSFIEMMIALTLLAIFGSSLFMVQSNLLTRLFKTHLSVQQLFAIDKEMLQFQQLLQHDLAEKKAPETINVHKENNDPEYTLDIKIKSISPNSALFKNFNKKIGIINTTIKQEGRSSSWYTFAYIVIPDKKDKEKEAKTATKEVTS